jgi:MFS family permease
MQVSIAAVTQFAGRPELNGVLYGIFATGNTLAAVAVGTIRWRRSAQARLLIAYPLLVLATVTLATAAQLTPWLTLLGALGLVAGLSVAPSMITGFTLVDLLVPAAVRTEAFTWLTGAVALGQAAGSMAAGQLTDGFGAGAGFLASAAGTGLALAALVIFRRRLAGRHGGRGSPGGVGHRAPATVD